MMCNFAFKVAIYGQKSTLVTPDKEILQKLLNQIYYQMEIPVDDANLFVIFGKYFGQLDIERNNPLFKKFIEFADILVD